MSALEAERRAQTEVTQHMAALEARLRDSLSTGSTREVALQEEVRRCTHAHRVCRHRFVCVCVCVRVRARAYLCACVSLVEAMHPLVLHLKEFFLS